MARFSATDAQKVKGERNRAYKVTETTPDEITGE